MVTGAGQRVCGDALGGHHLRLHGLAGLGLGQQYPWRGAHRTADVPDAPVAGLVAWAWAGEHYTGTAGGAAVTLGGVAIAQFSGSRRPAEAAPVID